MDSDAEGEAMRRWMLAVLVLLASCIALVGCGVASASTSTSYSFNGNGLPEYPNEGYIFASASESGSIPCGSLGITSSTYNTDGNVVNYYIKSSISASVSVDYAGGGYYGYLVEGVSKKNGVQFHRVYGEYGYISGNPWGTCSRSGTYTENLNTLTNYNFRAQYGAIPSGSPTGTYSVSDNIAVLITTNATHKISGTTGCLTEVSLYYNNVLVETNYSLATNDHYTFENLLNGGDYKLVFSDGAYYDFTCTGDEVFNYDACLYVYGYTCGIEHIKLWKDDGGWVLEDTYYQATIGVNPYEMVIENGNDYKLNFSDGHEHLFSCTGDHVLYDWDRCSWVDPPNGDPVPIIIYVGYDNRIVLLQDAHGNFIEHSQVAVYDRTDNIYLQKWTDNPDGYLVLTARFDTDHDVQIAVRTFDSVYTTTTVYPMNGTAENLTWTNWTIPIMYNIQMEPVDTYNVPLFDVFCGLAEYTPINPLSFWGMDFNRGYVPVTNCSGFSRCDIIAEKGGYVPYEVTALNWTSRSAMVKDYRHEIVMVKK